MPFIVGSLGLIAALSLLLYVLHKKGWVEFVQTSANPDGQAADAGAAASCGDGGGGACGG